MCGGMGGGKAVALYVCGEGGWEKGDGVAAAVVTVDGLGRGLAEKGIRVGGVKA